MNSDSSISPKLYIDKTGTLSSNFGQLLATEQSVPVPVAVEIFGNAHFKEMARKRRIETGDGSKKIWDFLTHDYGKNGFEASLKTVGNWIKGLPKGPIPESAEFIHGAKSISPVDAPYLMRLDVLKRNLFGSQGLTNAEANKAIELRFFFDNPDGHRIDLFPQLAIIDAYVRTEAAGMPLDHLDRLLTLQPWEHSGTAHYWRGLEEGLVLLPYIPMLTESFAGDPKNFVPLAYLAGAYAHLRIPVVSYYNNIENRNRSLWLNIEHHSGKTKPSPSGIEPFQFEELTPFCNWRTLIAASKKVG